MADPIATALAVGALGGAGGNLLSDGVKFVAPVLWRGIHAAVAEAMRRAAPQARRKLEENAAGFVAALAVEITAVESDEADPERIAAEAVRRLEDPDVAVTIQQALLDAGRTSSSERHAILAKTVAARLAAPSDTDRAIISRAASEMVGRLSQSQLGAVGILALVYGIAAPLVQTAASVLEVPEMIQAQHEAEKAPLAGAFLRSVGLNDFARRQAKEADAREAIRAFARQAALPIIAILLDLTARHRCAVRISPMDALHLISVGAIVAPNRNERLAAVLMPGWWDAPAPGHELLSTVQQHFADAIADGNEVAALRGAWHSGLSRLVPTAAGLLLGLAVHDTLTGEHRVREWEWASASGVGSLLSWPAASLRWP